MRRTVARTSRRARRAAARHGGRIYISYDGPFAAGTFEPDPGTTYRRLGSHRGTALFVDERMPLPKRLHVGLSLVGKLVVTTSFMDGDYQLLDDTG